MGQIAELTGRKLVELDASAAPGNWIFRFDVQGCFLGLGCVWRLVKNGSVVLASGDHQQLFGLEVPVDVVQRVHSALGGKAVTEARLAEGTGDLAIHFEDGTILQTFTDSSGYESCDIHLGGRQLVVVGGGGVAEF